ncbi:hypothetical protein BHE74_00025773 [Ensete ventricosum]|nr:hypothetical protein BHE74_00025773 [Ensete ventricosum]
MGGDESSPVFHDFLGISYGGGSSPAARWAKGTGIRTFLGEASASASASVGVSSSGHRLISGSVDLGSGQLFFDPVIALPFLGFGALSDEGSRTGIRGSGVMNVLGHNRSSQATDSKSYHVPSANIFFDHQADVIMALAGSSGGSWSTTYSTAMNKAKVLGRDDTQKANVPPSNGRDRNHLLGQVTQTPVADPLSGHISGACMNLLELYLIRFLSQNSYSGLVWNYGVQQIIEVVLPQEMRA